MLHTRSGTPLTVGRVLAAGGQGQVLEVTSQNGVVFKRYLPTTLAGDGGLARRLVSMVDNRPAQWRENVSGHVVLAWPTEVVLENGRFVGFLMPTIDMVDTVEL